MNKQQFLNALAEALKKLPREERYRTLSYYDELIDDRIEDGQNEYAVVESLGSPEAIAGDIFGSEEAEKTKKEYGKGAKIWIIVLLILGFPLWGSLLLVAVLLVLVAYILLCLPIVILGALALGFLGASVLGIVGTPFLIAEIGIQNSAGGIFQCGSSIALLGLSILCTVALVYTTKGIVRASKAIWRGCTAGFRKRRIAG